MITLPNIVTAASAKGELKGSDSAEGLHSVKSLPQDFLTELGNRLLTLAKQQGNAAQSAESAEEKEEAPAPKGQLDALLTAFDKTEGLNALLTPENIKAATKSADDKDKASAETLTNSETQSMQALFAMLPISPVAQRDASVAAGSSADTRRGAIAGNALSTLSQALSDSLAQSASSSASAPAHAETKASPTQTQLSAASAGPAAGTANASAPLTLDGSFQQALSNLGRQEEKSAPLTQTDSNALTSVASSSAAPLTMQTASATTSTPSTPMLNAQLGSDEWQQALSQQIVMFTRNGQQNAELRLHPADLGAIQISLKLDNDQAQINMASSHSHVRAALEAALPQLRNALAESGINLGQSQVSSDSFAQSQGFQQQQQQQEARRDGQHGAFSLSQDDDSEITPIAVPAALQARILGTGAVDTFA
ncbi:MAG: flagellar hook-length control protein FliK [Pantoea sp.]|uniref:flagellar hook-length control protein FliK n=1 Tax=Pantoea septica TaxID=472695 RepID=UPI001C105969|nr:flagellar hook-length control protein FliK [Pantoea septica]MBU5376390.1 flagellar hook-length control protein FliK [Pantoea septica]MDU6442794.1 flagellar hook-length control protein FliK [Pantoea sp.]